MLKSFTIKNFRCFENFSIEPLAQVNLIGGVNNVGKTSVLEALFLLLGANNPYLVIHINSFRGIENYKLSNTNSLGETLWGWIFWGNRNNKIIEIISTNDHFQQSLKIQLIAPDIARPIAEKNIESTPLKIPSSTKEFNTHELLLSYKRAEQEAISRIRVKSTGIEGEIAQISLLPMTIFCHARGVLAREDAERFSQLERVNRQEEILSALQALEPRLKRLAVIIQGDIPIIAGDIGIGELVPIALMGAGIGRLLSIVLAIANASNGFVLIDEIENGLHYSILVKVWQAIKLATTQYNTQVFATTHSLECIRAAHQAFETDENYDFRYHRLERVKDTIVAITYDRETTTTSIEMNFEMR